MTWKPDLSTREEVSGFVSDLLATLPDQLGIDEVIAGCEVLVLPAGAPPKYLDVALGGDAGPPQTGYTQAVLYRGGITGLAVGDYVTVIHLREGNRYEVLGPGGAAGVVPDPAPVDAQYVTMALDATLTDERVLTAGEWLALTDGGAGGLATLDFEPDNPVVVTAAGVVTEYASIQAAITAAAACETVLVPPGTYNEDITLKNGVCVKGFGPRDKVRITGDISIVTTASGGWLENVTIVMTNPPFADASSAVRMVHGGTCHIRQITIIGTQAAANPIRGIGVTGTGAGLLIADDIIIDISSAGNQAAYGVHLNLDSYELEMKNFKIAVDNSNGGALAHALGIVQASFTAIRATEGWLNVTATGAGTATDLFGTITYSEIVDTSDDTLFGQKVGVGIAAPLYDVHVFSSGHTTVKIESDSNNAILRLDAPADEYAYIEYQTAGTWDWQLMRPANQTYLDLLSSTGRVMTWLKNGNVGFKTATPGADVEIAGVGATADTQMFRLSNAVNTAFYWEIWRDNLDGDLRFGDALGGAKTTHVTFETGGNIGIGTTVPQGLLHGYDTIGGLLYWEGNVTGGGETTVLPNAAGDVVYGFYSMCVATDRGANTNQQLASQDTPGAGSVTRIIYDDGVNRVEMRLYSTGQLTIDETVGAATIYVNLWLIWQ